MSEDTSYLIDCVEDNSEVNDASWSDWSDASDKVDLYVRTAEDPETMEVAEERRRPGLRGIEILKRAIAGEDPLPLMKAWREDLYGR